MHSDHLPELWQQVHKKLQYLHGSPVLAPEAGARNEGEDAIAFLQTCSSDHFLDFIEYIFQVEVFWRQQTDTAAPLLKTVLSHTTLDPFFKDPLTLVATIRNRLSTAHGAGVQPKAVSPQVARYALNATATAILLLVEETR